MCGRFILTASPDVLAEQVGLEPGWAAAVGGVPARYNIAPSQAVLVFRNAAEEQGEFRQATRLRWGLIPFWAKDAKIGYRMINARSETVADKPAFRAPFRHRRCLIPADGFYEWQKQGKTRQPFCIRMQDEAPFAIAGLWERWQGPDGEDIESCTVLTCEPNALLQPIHDRMPVILQADDFERWLDPELQRARDLLPLIRPADPKTMKAYPVSTRVNSPKADGPDCIDEQADDRLL